MLNYILTIFGLFVFVGCAMDSTTGIASMSNELNYSVMVINGTNSTIEVFPIKLHPQEKMSVDVGIVIPGGKAVMGKFHYRPEKTHTIKWKEAESGKLFEAKVNIDLPKEFNKENGSTIRLFVLPNVSKVKVIYKIFDENSDSFVEVEGK